MPFDREGITGGNTLAKCFDAKGGRSQVSFANAGFL